MGTENHIQVVAENDIAPTGNVFVFNPDSLEELRKRKLIRENGEAVELDGVGMGETVVGTLNETEQALYIEVAILHSELADMHRELMARTFDIYAASVRSTMSPAEAHAKFSADGGKVFPSEQEAEEYFALATKYEYLKAYYTLCIRERFGHGWVYGVRRAWQIVRTERKYELPK